MMLEEITVFPVIRANSADVAIRVAGTLIDAGMPTVEITLTVPNAVDAIAKLTRANRVEAMIGAGTVTTADEARAVIRAGALFIVSPALLPDVIEVARKAHVMMIAGALTPTEILDALRAGADLVKVFPVQSLGGPTYIRSLRGPFPDLPLVATGGVSIDNVADYFRAGATAVGVGSELISHTAVAAGDYDAIGRRAEQFLAAIASVRREGATP
jgi:2-dehydro-3-deoxyphosphogluconate aldolase/(4S)-4-hydroxy-2-oxoglutarate aldolase